MPFSSPKNALHIIQVKSTVKLLRQLGNLIISEIYFYQILGGRDKKIFDQTLKVSQKTM